MTVQRKHIYEFGPFQLIPSERQLLRGNQLLSLTGKSFDLLVVLVENSGRLIGKEELLKCIWPDSYVEEANLSVNMTTLRRALGDGPEDHQYVETVPRHGYRFVAEVKERWENGAQSSRDQANVSLAPNVEVKVAPTLSSSEKSQKRILGWWPLVIGGLVVLAGFLIALKSDRLRDRLFGNSTPVEIRSLAVLPLKNVSGDATQDYFVQGVTDALIDNFAKVDGLRVMSRAAAIKYRDAQNLPSEIGRALKVDAVMIGSVTRTGDRVRVALQLTHVPSGRNLWRKEYDRDVRDAVTLPAQVRRDAAENMGLKSLPAPPEAAAVNSEAYDHYLRGKFYLYRQTKQDNEAAIAALEQAVAKDPTFAAAYAELAQAYTWKLFLFAPTEKQLEEKAFVAGEKALALDPNSAVAYLARGRLLWTPANHFPHDRAIKEYRRALELDPNLDEARNQLALVYCHIGAFAEALQESKLALTTDPNNNLAQYRIGQTLNYQGKYEEALAVLRAIPEKANPALVGHQTAWALFNLGRKEEASAMLDKLIKDHPEDAGGVFTSIQAVLAAASGQERIAEARIKSAIEKGKGFGHFHHTAYHIACAYAFMKKPEQAIKWLEAAAQDGFPCYPLFETDPNLNNLRQDPRFLTFLAKQKQEWEHYKSIL